MPPLPERRVSRTLAIAFALGMTLSTSVSAGDPDVYQPNTDPAVGFNLISWANFGGSGANRWREAVRGLHEAGFSEVSISPVRFVNPATGVIASSSSKGPELSHIAAGVAEAKSLGMRVTVNPFVEPENFAFWRGQYDPNPGSQSWSTFWQDYEDYLVEVAVVAQANGADALNVGTELRAITRNSGNNGKWASVIAAVDDAFTGELGYAANWDNYRNGNLTDAVWKNPAIDYLGIDAYFRDTTSNAESDASGADPNEAFITQVEQGWNDRLDNEILPFAASLRAGGGLPVVLTEVGYLPYNRTTVTPQNNSGAVDTDEQVMAFKGLTRALNGRKAELGAIHVWQWGMAGSNGSQWNIAAGAPSDQPNNIPLGKWLSGFVSAPALAGDFNGDSVVDAADYATWRDGTRPVSDYQVWAERYGDALVLPGQVVSIPEPLGVSLALSASLAAIWRGFY
ncbi:hypothetical protein Pla123a_23120 [Posidoniimonas polymericola]|uniref:GTA TIM-barrel-like domain-containing protein n=1 Tax=Posidoniimonas polymericola TaxID=2528002 RepID=A0A5C5YQ16_9BACT|nr:glycoside hydrolase TIM-barrel-like domain-containing protein [Posidoniimonas polymericola]TWT76888.1 hypothetical protein Pla123a_23120 [Posidoniimonas polymericola]